MTDEPLIRDISDTARWVAVYRARETDRSDAVFKDPEVFFLQIGNVSPVAIHDHCRYRNQAGAHANDVAFINFV